MIEANSDNLMTVFNKNIDKRICVLGTTCTGKSTLINDLNIGLDMDEEVFPLLTKEETDYVCSTPWTEEIEESGIDTIVLEVVSNKKKVVK